MARHATTVTRPRLDAEGKAIEERPPLPPAPRAASPLCAVEEGVLDGAGELTAAHQSQRSGVVALALELGDLVAEILDLTLEDNEVRAALHGGFPPARLMAAGRRSGKPQEVRGSRRGQLGLPLA